LIERDEFRRFTLSNSPSILSDEALASRAAGGEREAFGLLVTRHEQRLFRFLSRAAANTADVEDAMQQAMVKAYVNLARYNPRWKFTTWLYTIALRELRTIGRRSSSGIRRVGLSDASDVADRGAELPHEALAAQQDGADLWMLAQRVLNIQQYTALWLRFGEDLAPKEVARVMRRPRIWVSVTLHRACGVLRQFARDPGEPPAERSSTRQKPMEMDEASERPERAMLQSKISPAPVRSAGGAV